MLALFEELQQRLSQQPERSIRTSQVKLKFSNFKQTTVERASFAPDIATFRQLIDVGWARGGDLGIRLLGLGVGFSDTALNDHQLDLFETPAKGST